MRTREQRIAEIDRALRDLNHRVQRGDVRLDCARTEASVLYRVKRMLVLTRDRLTREPDPSWWHRLWCHLRRRSTSAVAVEARQSGIVSEQNTDDRP